VTSTAVAENVLLGACTISEQAVVAERVEFVRSQPPVVG